MLDHVSYGFCTGVVEATVDGFSERKHLLDGVEVSTFNYSIFAGYEQFYKFNAKELRGLTFVKNNDGTYSRYLMFNKFFNLGEGDHNSFETLKSKPIKYVQNKLDGSLIRFIRINGKVYAKTQNSFNNPQSEAALQLYNTNENLKNFIDETLDNNLAALFEFTSPFNQIVCLYTESKISLLALREENTGKYLDIYNNPLVLKYGVCCTEKITNFKTLEELKLAAFTTQDIEGWIVVFEDDHRVKVKTKWYLARHHLVANINCNSNSVFSAVLTGDLNDILSNLGDSNPIKAYFKHAQDTLTEFFKKQKEDCLNLLEKSLNLDRKTFALQYHKDPMFHLAVGFYGIDSLDNLDKTKLESFLIEFLLKRYKKEENCTKLFKSLDIKMEDFIKSPLIVE